MVKYLYKKLLEKDLGSVYKTYFIARGGGSSRPNTLQVRGGSLFFNSNSAVPCKVFYLLLTHGIKPHTSPKGRGRHGAGRRKICLNFLLNTPFCQPQLITTHSFCHRSLSNKNHGILVPPTCSSPLLLREEESGM